MSHDLSEIHNPSEAAARLHDVIDEQTAVLRKSVKRWRKTGRKKARRLRGEVEAGAERLGDEVRARPVTTGAVVAGLTAFAALAGWAAWRNRRPDA